MSAPACPVCGAHSDLGCERTDEDEPCPYPEPDPDHQREMRDEMRRLWPDAEGDLR